MEDSLPFSASCLCLLLACAQFFPSASRSPPVSASLIILPPPPTLTLLWEPFVSTIVTIQILSITIEQFLLSIFLP